MQIHGFVGRVKGFARQSDVTGAVLASKTSIGL
jgi:hypothetical protein